MESNPEECQDWFENWELIHKFARNNNKDGRQETTDAERLSLKRESLVEPRESDGSLKEAGACLKGKGNSTVSANEGEHKGTAKQKQRRLETWYKKNLQH